MLTFTIYTKNRKFVDDTHTALYREFGDNLEYSIIGDANKFLFHLRYDMPQFVLFDLDDPDLDSGFHIKHLGDDPWLINIGIFGVTEKLDENANASPSLFSTLSPSQLKSLLPHLVHILANNEQLLLQTGLIHDLGRSGSFHIENKPHLLEAYAELLTTTLYNQGYIEMQGKYGVKFSLVEMLMNAVEHGNCNITFSEKQAWLEEGNDMLSLIQQKCKDPEVDKKRVTLTYEINEENSIFTIRDEGHGFDVSTLPDPTNPVALLDLHGRGIFMTRNYVESLQYNDLGNEVKITVMHVREREHKIPEGFRENYILHFEPGDIVFRENDKGNTLYYIVSGEFEIFVNEKVINTLNNRSVFLGEMAFLIGNRRTATVKAKTPAKLVSISVREWMEVVQKFPYYGIFLARLLAKKLDQQSHVILY